MKIKRLLAHFIDIYIVSFIAALLFGLLPVFNDEYNDYISSTKEYTDILLHSTSGSSDIDEDELIDIEYNIETQSKPILFMRTGLLLLYFGVISYLWKGQTLGKKLFKLQIVPNKGENLNPGLFILRSVLVTSLIPEIASLIVLITCSKTTWYNASLIISNISYFANFIIFGFILFRDDERGLHDLLCNTKVISTKNPVKETVNENV